MKKYLLPIILLSSLIGSNTTYAQTKLVLSCGMVNGVQSVAVTDPSGNTTCQIPSSSQTSGAGSAPAATTNTSSTITPCGQNCNLPYTPLEPIPGVTSGQGGTYDLTSPGGFAKLINSVFTILISVGALVAVLSLTIGGVQYMTASSLGNKKNGIDRAKASLYGILLIAAIWLILNTLNPYLLNFNFNPCPVGSDSTSCKSLSYTNTSSASGATATGANATVNGGGTVLGPATVGTITGAQMRAANDTLGLDGGLLGRGVAMDQALVYDPSDLSAVNSAAINAFTSECQSDFASNVTLGYVNTHSVAIVPGSVVGASGESAMVCISN